MKKEFKVETYGAPDILIVNLNRKQIEHMVEVIANFKEIDQFQLRVSNSNGIGQSIHFTFDMDLTDTSNW
jgi:hypothetical protein